MIAWTPRRKRFPVILLSNPTEHVHILRFEPEQWREVIKVLVHWHADLELLDLSSAQQLADEVERFGRQYEAAKNAKPGVFDKVAQIGKEMLGRFLKGQ